MSADEISELKQTTKPDDELAFSRIKEEIETQAKLTAENIIDRADKEVKEILEIARNESLKIKNDIMAKASRDATNVKVQDISRKKLSLKMDYLETRETVFEEIFVEARSKIQKYTTTGEYKKYLIHLLSISGNSIGGGNFNLFVRKEDKSTFTKEVLTDSEQKISKFADTKTSITLVKKDLRTLGGLKLVRGDTKMFVDNTFEKRLERANDEIRIELSDLISE